jgi:hypothetical protein
MYCPECGGEYREGFLECASCGVALVATPPPEPAPPPDPDLVTVLETGDPSALALAESLLMEEGIQYLKKGESLQDLFALGRLALGFSPIAGPVVVQVAREDAEAAAQLLADVRTGPPSTDEEGPIAEEGHDEEGEGEEDEEDER